MRTTLFFTVLAAFLAQTDVFVTAIPIESTSGLYARHRGHGGGRHGGPGGRHGFGGGAPGGGAAGPAGADAASAQAQRRDLDRRAKGQRTASHIHGVSGFLSENLVPSVVDEINAHIHRRYVQEDAELARRKFNKDVFKTVGKAVGKEALKLGAQIGLPVAVHAIGSQVNRRYAGDEEAFERREIDEQELARRSFLKTAFSVGKKLIGTFLKREDYAEMAEFEARDLTADEHAFLNHVSSRSYDADAEELAQRSMSEEELERRSFWKSALKVGGKILGSFIKRDELSPEARALVEDVYSL